MKPAGQRTEVSCGHVLADESETLSRHPPVDRTGSVLSEVRVSKSCDCADIACLVRRHVPLIGQGVSERNVVLDVVQEGEMFVCVFNSSSERSRSVFMLSWFSVLV